MENEKNVAYAGTTLDVQLLCIPPETVTLEEYRKNNGLIKYDGFSDDSDDQDIDDDYSDVEILDEILIDARVEDLEETVARLELPTGSSWRDVSDYYSKQGDPYPAF